MVSLSAMLVQLENFAEVLAKLLVFVRIDMQRESFHALQTRILRAQADASQTSALVLQQLLIPLRSAPKKTSPLVPLWQRGIFGASPLTRLRSFIIPLFGKEGLGEICGWAAWGFIVQLRSLAINRLPPFRADLVF